MSIESQGIDPYETVLADLRAKREQIDHTIQLLESLRGGSATSAPAGVAPRPAPTVDGPGAFLGMTIADAAKTLLASRRRPLGNVEISQAFKAGGLVLQSADPINTIGAVLTRRFNEKGDIVKIGRGIWGLPEWYPGRSFKKKEAKGDQPSAEGAAPMSETSEPEQPSPPPPISVPK